MTSPEFTHISNSGSCGITESQRRQLFCILKRRKLDDIDTVEDPVTAYPLQRIVAAAFHEAGHAVIAMLLSVRVESAVVDPRMPEGGEEGERGVLGHVTLSRDDRVPADSAMISMAGFTAEYLAMNRVSPVGASTDFRDIEEQFRLLGDDRVEARYHYQYLCAQVQRRLTNAWPAAILIAEALVFNRDLSGEDVYELFIQGNKLCRTLESETEASEPWTSLVGSQARCIRGVVASQYFRFECFRWVVRNMKKSGLWAPYTDAAAQIRP